MSWALERQLKGYLKQTVKRVYLPSKRDLAFFRLALRTLKLSGVSVETTIRSPKAKPLRGGSEVSQGDIALLLPELLHGQLFAESFGAVIGRHQMLAGLMVKYPSFQRDLCMKGGAEYSPKNGTPSEAQRGTVVTRNVAHP